MNRVFKWCFVSFSHRQLYGQLESFMTQMTRDHHQCYPGKVTQQLVLWTAPTFGNIVEDLVLYHQVTHPIAVHEDPGDEDLSNMSLKLSGNSMIWVFNPPVHRRFCKNPSITGSSEEVSHLLRQGATKASMKLWSRSETLLDLVSGDTDRMNVAKLFFQFLNKKEKVELTQDECYEDMYVEIL